MCDVTSARPSGDLFPFTETHLTFTGRKQKLRGLGPTVRQYFLLCKNVSFPSSFGFTVCVAVVHGESFVTASSQLLSAGKWSSTWPRGDVTLLSPLKNTKCTVKVNISLLWHWKILSVQWKLTLLYPDTELTVCTVKSSTTHICICRCCTGYVMLVELESSRHCALSLTVDTFRSTRIHSVTSHLIPFICIILLPHWSKLSYIPLLTIYVLTKRAD